MRNFTLLFFLFLHSMIHSQKLLDYSITYEVLYRQYSVYDDRCNFEKEEQCMVPIKKMVFTYTPERTIQRISEQRPIVYGKGTTECDYLEVDRKEYTYDDKSNILSETSFDRDMDTVDFYSKTTYKYDENRNVTEMITYDRESQSPERKIVYDYNSNGDTLAYEAWIWNINIDTWEIEERRTNSFDEDFNLILQTQCLWLDDELLLSEKKYYIMNPYDSMVLSLILVLAEDSETWDTAGITEYTYNEKGKIQSATIIEPEDTKIVDIYDKSGRKAYFSHLYFWDKQSKSWSLHDFFDYQTEFTSHVFNNDGQLVREGRYTLRSSYDHDGYDTSATAIIEYSYNEEGRLTTMDMMDYRDVEYGTKRICIMLSYETDGQVHEKKRTTEIGGQEWIETLRYDNSGNIILKEKVEIHGGETIGTEYKYEYVFNTKGNLIRETIFPDRYDDGMTKVYDANGRLIEEIHFIYEGNKIKRKILYVYKKDLLESQKVYGLAGNDNKDNYYEYKYGFYSNDGPEMNNDLELKLVTNYFYSKNLH